MKLGNSYLVLAYPVPGIFITNKIVAVPSTTLSATFLNTDHSVGTRFLTQG
jgi:hypothetical protein